MKQVTLEQLACVATEDWTGADDCRLEVYADGVLEDVYRAQMDDGMTWPLGITVLFDQAASVRLFDEDTPDADDLLGTITIGAGDDGTQHGAFDADGADYRLSYVVADRDDLTSDALLEAEIQAFEGSDAAGVWTQVAKEALIADMRATIADPVTQIHQSDSSFCGPTSIVFELADRMPRRYVRLCRWLYETGSFVTATQEVTASDELRSMAPGHGMTAGDWLLIASMRESENAVFGVDPGGSDVMNGVEGLTTPWEMEGWTREVLCKANAATSTTFLWGEMDALRYADRVHRAGGVAFLLIHDVLLDEEDQSSFVPPFPTHWVPYRGGLAEADGRVDFWVYTWGKDQRLDRTVDRLESCLFTVVTGF